MKKKMSLVELALHLVVWLGAIVGMFWVWSFCDDYRRILVAPKISAMGDVLSALAVIIIIFGDCYRNDERFKRFIVEVLKGFECRHQARLERVARREAARQRAKECKLR